MKDSLSPNSVLKPSPKTFSSPIQSYFITSLNLDTLTKVNRPTQLSISLYLSTVFCWLYIFQALFVSFYKTKYCTVLCYFLSMINSLSRQPKFICTINIHLSIINSIDLFCKFDLCKIYNFLRYDNHHGKQTSCTVISF